METHHLRARGTLGLSDAKDDNNFSVLGNFIHDESIRRVDLHTVSAPPKPL
jgi:hypothetical protein